MSSIPSPTSAAAAPLNGPMGGAPGPPPSVFGPLQSTLSHAIPALLHIQLVPFPTHYLVLVVTDTDFRYALISVKIVPDSIYRSLVMKDIGWLDVERICGRGQEARAHNAAPEPGFGSPSVESSKSVPEMGCWLTILPDSD